MVDRMGIRHRRRWDSRERCRVSQGQTRNGAMIAIVAVAVVALIASAVFLPGNLELRQKLRRHDRYGDAMNDADIEEFF